MNTNWNSLLAPNDSEFENSLNRIKKSGYSMPIYSSVLKNASGIKIPFDFVEEDVRRSDITDCKVYGSDFSRAVFADSRCFETEFKNITLKHTNVEYCNFDSCDFIDENKSKPYIGTNFSFSNFINCQFDGIEIKNSTLDSVSFDNSRFENTRIYMSTVENTKFQNCLFYNVQLCDLNLCFSEFEQVHMQNVSLPFYQLPYVFGGMHYFLHTDDNVYIGPDEPGGSILRPEQYRQLLPDIVTYFKKYNEYFPVANIYMACEEYQLAFETIIHGIEMASHRKDFRMLKFLCKLAADTHMFTYKQLQSLYDRIYDAATFGYMTDYEKKSYFIHLGTIRKLLLFNDAQRATLEFRMLTNIENSDSERLGIFIAQIENIFSIFQDQNIIYNIEMKHQCPWEVIYVVIGAMPQIQCILNSLLAVLAPTGNVLSFINTCISLVKNLCSKKDNNYHESELDKQIKEQQLVLLKQEEEKNRQQLYLNSLEIQNLEQQLLHANQIFYQNNITATPSYHFK